MTVAPAILQLLHYAVAAGFIFLGLASVVDWSRYRDRSHGWLAVALGLLGLTSLLGLFPKQLAVLPQLSLMAFMASGYALVRFRACFLPLSRGRLRVVGLVVAVSTLVVLVVPLPSSSASRYTALQLAIICVLVGIWSACVGEPAVRFWLASRRRPAVQRARLRALSAGYGGIVGLLVFAVAAGASSTAVVVATQVAALAVVPLLYAGFAPPSWLRRLWRAREEDKHRKATQELLLFAADMAALMELALEWSTRLVGADAGVIASRQGEVLAARNLAAADAAALAHRLGGTTPRPGGTAREDRLLVVPIVAEPEGVTLIVKAGPFTPLFGSDEVAGLENYTPLVALAMSRVRLVEDLARQTELYQDLLQHISDMGEGLVLSGEGGVTYSNEAYARMTGYTQEELSNLASTIDLGPPENPERVAREPEGASPGGAAIVHNETQLITRDGDRIHIESVVRRRMVEGVPGTVAIVRDISDRKRAEAAQVSKSAVMATLASATTWTAAAPSVMSSICDHQGWDLAEYWSVGAAGGLCREHVWQGTGSAGPELTGSDLDQDLPQRAWSRGTAVWGPEMPKPGNGNDDGSGAAHAARGAVAFPIRSGEGTVGVMALYSRERRRPDRETEAALADVGSRIGDFLDRKTTEIAIRKLNETLELRVAERTASNRELEAFVYTVSHDLRAPLRAIDGFVGALIEDYRAELPAGAREFLDDVASNARQMAKLIEDLLAFSRLNRLLPRRQEVDPGRIARQVMEQLKPELAGRDVAVAIDELPTCSADPALLAQVYTNLLSNALKYSRRRDRAEIRVGCRTDAGGNVYFVEDNGVGFDPAYMDKLFGVFQRLHSTDEYEGTGVGLAIVQRIVERHGGAVWAESALDQGTTFFFRLKEVAEDEGK
jgi:PAS domain S-box-containing protein